MNLRNRLKKILDGEKPDKLPWYADVSYWHFSQSEKKELDDNYSGLEGLIKLHKDLNVGFYLSGFKPIKATYSKGKFKGVPEGLSGYDDMLHIFSHVIGASSDKGEDNKDLDTNVDIETPFGVLSERWKYNLKTFSWAPIEYFIKSKDDIQAFKYWINNSNFEKDYDSVKDINEKVKDIGFTLGLQPRSPFQQLVTTFAGLEGTVNLWLEDKVLFDELINLMEIKSDESAKITLESPVEFIMIPENLSSVMVGKKFFNDYLKNYQKKWYKNISNRKKYSMIHFDGTLKGLLGEVAQTNPTVIEAMTPYPLGDLNVEEFKDYVMSDSIMWGGIPGPFFTDSVSDKEFENFVLKTIDIMLSEPRYVLGIGDQIPPDGSIKRIEKVSKLIEKYGSY